jgi:hypothetical protein
VLGKALPRQLRASSPRFAFRSTSLAPARIQAQPEFYKSSSPAHAGGPLFVASHGLLAGGLLDDIYHNSLLFRTQYASPADRSFWHWASHEIRLLLQTPKHPLGAGLRFGREPRVPPYHQSRHLGYFRAHSSSAAQHSPFRPIWTSVVTSRPIRQAANGSWCYCCQSFTSAGKLPVGDLSVDVATLCWRGVIDHQPNCCHFEDWTPTRC